mmetsp:Transcript_52460/g.123237  ORF Transcript_52460/g.123237 Transcript_52460/m.123237 type:complete len:265 (+) Transcript_52460:755-1549(+)
MHPSLHILASVGGLTLGNLVFMVRENEVRPTTMDVQGLSQILLRHGTAFDVPAWSPWPPGRVPVRLLWLGGLPKYEVFWRLLQPADLDPSTRLIAFQAAPGQSAVLPKAPNAEIDIATVSLRGLLAHVGKLFVDQRANHGLDLRQVLGDSRLEIRRIAAKACGVGLHLFFHPAGQCFRGLSILQASLNDLVVDVRHIADEGHFVTYVPHVADSGVEEDHHSCMTYVAKVIDRHATHVHLDHAGLQCSELFLRPSERVVDLKLWG